LKVLASFFPLQDWAEDVGGSKVTVSLLVPSTQDVHEFEPTSAALLAIATADVLLLNGAGLEPWAQQAVAAAGNTKLVVVDCSRNASLITVPAQFQMGNRTIDPHIWLDPVDAMTMVRNILQGFVEADSADAAYFTANADNYEVKLESLDRQFVSLGSSNLATREFVTFHTSFGYLAQRYNLTQVPVFGPFEEEPTAAEISSVVGVINSHHLLYVGYESLQNQAIPKAIASQTNATLVPMNPIEGLSPAEASQGQTYLTLMAQTLLVLTLALNNVGH
jgi:zinc transport system substrate-binding protein